MSHLRHNDHEADCRFLPAFTLVELLVVIGIIALLIAILLPALNRARESANLVKCLATLRNMSQAAQLHANEHRGYMPVAGVQGPRSAGILATADGLNDGGRRKYTYQRGDAARPLPLPTALAYYMNLSVTRSDNLAFDWTDALALEQTLQRDGIRQAPSVRRRARHSPAHANPLYGYGYFVNWPSILSIAHDPTDGSGLFIITDRPCVLVGPSLPLEVAGLSIVAATMILPVKVRLTMSDAVPQGAAWQWLAGGTQLYDPITGHGINAASGECADVPGPHNPPPPPVTANVVAQSAGGATCTLTFDQPIVLSGGAIDDAIVFDGQPATGVVNVDANTLGFDVPFASEGSTWSIVRQPAWVTTPLTVPQSGAF